MKATAMTINPNEVGLHVRNEAHMRNFLQGRKITRNKKAYTRKEKHRKQLYY